MTVWLYVSFVKCIYLEVRITETVFNVSLCRCPQQSGLGQAQARTRTSIQDAHLGSSTWAMFCCSPGALAGTWIGGGAAGSWTSALMGGQHDKFWLMCHIYYSVGPCDFVISSTRVKGSRPLLSLSNSCCCWSLSDYWYPGLIVGWDYIFLLATDIEHLLTYYLFVFGKMFMPFVILIWLFFHYDL